MTKPRHAHDGMRMATWIRRWVYAVGVATALTGVLWLILHHFVLQEGEFGPEPHWVEPHLLSAHGATAMLALWVFGLIWLPHVRRGWHQKRNRWMGIAMVVIAVILAASGWGLYYIGSEDWRPWISLLHWVLGLWAIGWLPLHVWRGRRSAQRQ